MCHRVVILFLMFSYLFCSILGAGLTFSFKNDQSFQEQKYRIKSATLNFIPREDLAKKNGKIIIDVIRRKRLKKSIDVTKYLAEKVKGHTQFKLFPN